MANPLLQARYDRQMVAIAQRSGRAQLPAWLEQHTRNPMAPAKPWSFKDHEYQIEILRTEAEFLSVIKAAQTGMSELSVRMALALASLYPSTNWIYILPSLLFARRFSTSRMDPVIENSPTLRSMISKEVNSSEMKKLAQSFLYFVGAQSQRQSISIPAKGLVMDEVDFCSATVLTSFMSRLGHNRPGESIITRFSTPTLPGYGISKMHDDGSQAVYMVWHEKCSHWVVIHPLHNIVLPGYDEDTLINFNKSDLDNPLLDFAKSWVQCPHCKQEITQQNLCTPQYRAWVHRYPERDQKSFYVSPLDVPAINTPEKILRNVDNYERHDDWVNFGLGVPYQSAENSVVLKSVKDAAKSYPITPAERCAVGCVMGSDVGKTSHRLVGKRNGKYLDIVWAERVRQTGDNVLLESTMERMRQYGVWRFVIDAGPDITTPQAIIDASSYRQSYACYFVRQPKKDLSEFEEDEFTQTLKVPRTNIIDKVVKDLNGGLIRFMPESSHPEMSLVFKHLSTMRRVKRISDTTGETLATWTSVSTENHYFFALVYLYLADMMVKSGLTTIPLPMNGLVKKVRMASASG